MLKARGNELIAVYSPDSFVADTPSANLIRQVLGAVSNSRRRCWSRSFAAPANAQPARRASDRFMSLLIIDEDHYASKETTVRRAYLGQG